MNKILLQAFSLKFCQMAIWFPYSNVGKHTSNNHKVVKAFTSLNFTFITVFNKFSMPKKIAIETKKEGGGKQNLWLLCHFLIYLLYLYQKTTKCTAFQRLFVRTKKWIDYMWLQKRFLAKFLGEMEQKPWGVLPMMAYTGRLWPKGVSFQGFCEVYELKCRDFTSSSSLILALTY